MASIVFQSENNHTRVLGELLTTVTTTTVGSWVRLDGLHPFTVTIDVSSDWDGTVRIHTSDAATRPADSTTGSTLADFTNGATPGYDEPYTWIKASVFVYNAGTVNHVGIHGRR